MRSKTVLAAVVLTVLMAGLQGVASAVPAAPNWLPGQPMLAGNQIVAMWLPVPGAVKYIVYLDGKKVSESPANQYIGAAPTAGGEHKYEVTAVDASGAESPKSLAGVVKIVMIEPPKEITARAVSAERSVHIRWEVPQGASIFNLYRGEAKDGKYELISSSQEPTYKDSGLELEKKYYYRVSAKDMSGKESARSAAFEVFIPKPKVQKKEIATLNLDMNILKTEQGDTIDYIGDFPITPVQNVKKGPDGNNWIATVKGWLLALDDSLDITESIRTKRPEKLRSNLPLLLGDFAFSRDGDVIYYTIPGGGFLVALDRAKGEIIWARQYRYPEESDDPVMFANRPKGTFDNPIPVLTGVTVLADDTVLVAEEKSPLRYVVDPDDGELEGWQDGFVFEGEHTDGNPVSLLLSLEDGSVAVVESIGRRVVIINPETTEVKHVLGAIKNGYLGGFLGIRGVAQVPGRPWLMVADPAFATVQVFDTETASYLYHLGDNTGKPNAEDPTRASYIWAFPAFPIIHNDGRNVLLYDGMAKSFVDYTLGGSLTDMGDPVVAAVKERIAQKEAAEAAEN